MSGVQFGLKSYEWSTKSDQREAGADLLIKGMITDWIGRREVFWPINHKYYIFRGSYKGQKAGEEFGNLSILWFCLKFGFFSNNCRCYRD